MKSALQKSPIPHTHAFVVQELKQPFFDPNWHFHPEYQLFMVIKGKGTRFIGDHVKTFQEGEITFLGPDLPHLWRSDPEEVESKNNCCAEGIVVYFQENFIGNGLLYKEEGIKLRQLFDKSLRGFDVKGKTAEEVKQRLLELPGQEGFDAVMGLLHILNSLSQTDEIELLASSGYRNTLKESDSGRMSRVYAYVMKNFKNRIPISDVAAIASMTPTSFSRYFKTHTNKTFSEFVSEIRIGHSCKLLIEKKMNASQACYDSGFRTLSNFNRQFKATTGKTPREYKKRYEMR